MAVIDELVSCKIKRGKSSSQEWYLQIIHKSVRYGLLKKFQCGKLDVAEKVRSRAQKIHYVSITKINILRKI